MPQVSRYWKVNEKTALQAGPLLTGCLASGWPTGWAEDANSLTVYRGLKPGHASFVFNYADTQALMGSGGPYEIKAVEVDEVGNETTVTFKDWYPTKAFAVTGVIGQNKQAYLVQFVDSKFYLGKSRVLKKYNYRRGFGDKWIDMEDGTGSTDPTPKTWEEVLHDLWDQIGGLEPDPPDLVDPPADSKPENLYFNHIRTVDAIEQLLTQISRGVVLDPFTGEFETIDLSGDQSDLDSALEQAAASGRLIWDYAPITRKSYYLPKTVKPIFLATPGVRALKMDDGANEIEAATDQTLTTDAPEWTLRVIDTTSNAVADAINDREPEIKAAVEDYYRPGVEPMAKIFSGFLQVKPGPKCTTITWRTTIDGGSTTDVRNQMLDDQMPWPEICPPLYSGFTVATAGAVVSGREQAIDYDDLVTEDTRADTANTWGIVEAAAEGTKIGAIRDSTTGELATIYEDCSDA